MNDIAISAEHIGKCYRVYDNNRSRLASALLPGRRQGVEELWALRDVNFVIRKGESVALIGRNGGGKSTLLEILTGTLTPTTGSVNVQGRVCALLELGSGFNPEYSGRENVILNGLLLGLSKEQIVSRMGEIEAFAEIGSAIDRPVKTYSSGMMVRLAFAVQVLSDPDILIIDEALSVGDFFFQQKCMSYIRCLKERGVTLLFVSHDMGAVRDVCERGILLNGGSVAFDGDKQQAIRAYLSAHGASAAPEAEQAGKQALQVTQPHLRPLKEPFWRADLATNKSTRLLALGLYDDQSDPRSSFKMASSATVLLHVKTTETVAPHLHIEIKNKHDQIVTSLGTLGMGIARPATGTEDELHFSFNLKLSIEAGNYSLRAYIVKPSGDGTTGEVVDETPWLGPIEVFWNYGEELPPFAGMFGMECTGAYE